MPKRTSPNDIQSWDDAQDLDRIVIDKRSIKRATPEKGRRRNRRYGKRLINAQLEIDSEIAGEDGESDLNESR
jgi:hypothetical protein